jgi:hypothetical protein
MSKIKLLLDVIADVQHLGESLTAYANALTASDKLEDNDFKQIYPPEETEISTKLEEETVPDNQPEPEKEIAIEEVRALLGEKMRAGYSTKVKALLAKYGAEKLSKIDKSKYSALLKEAEAIGS